MAKITDIPNEDFPLINAKSWKAQDCTHEEINNLKKGSVLYIDGLDDNFCITVISNKDNMITGTITGVNGTFRFPTDYIKSISTY
jgi:hypothetical protein